MKILRPSQWVKNAFLFAPLIFSRHLFDPVFAVRELTAFSGFCLVSSVIYILNDIVDREADKLHPVKKNRPLASGVLGIPEAVAVAVFCIGLLALLMPHVGARFWDCIALYAILNLAYSFFLKRIVLVDVFIIAAGFMLRVLAGVLAIEVEISPWLVLCTLFISVFLAVSKRRGELILVEESDSFRSRPVLRQYDVAFVDQLMTVTASGMAISYALYTVADRTVTMFGTENLIFTTVFVLFGIFRYIYLMRLRKTDDNPMHILLTDIPMIVNILIWFVSCVAIIYHHELIP